MRNLIIIGNGFDLAHNLKTSYSDFKNDIIKYSEEPVAKSLGINNLLTSFVNDEFKLWSDIEIAYFDILMNFKDKKELYNKYKPVHLYDSVEALNDDFDEIINYLSDYLLEEEKNFIPVENYKTFFEEFNNKETVVINFNYTRTVEKYLEDKNIELIHIHGKLEDDTNPLIFGFAAEHDESKKLLIENDNNYVRNIKKFNYLFSNNDILLKEHLESDEYNVFILGHSCGISDRLILSEIFNSKKIHKIIPFYHMDRKGYFNTMVNIDRIIDDYSKTKNDKSFNKLVSFPSSYKMPQRKNDVNLVGYLKTILDKKLPIERKISFY